MLIGLLNSGNRYYGAMKHRLMEIVTQRSGLHGELVKSGIRLASLNVINIEKNGCFGANFIAILRDLVSFGRRIGVLSTRRPIDQRLYPLLMVGYVFVRRKASNYFLCKILRLLTLQKALSTSFMSVELYALNGLHIRPIWTQLRLCGIGWRIGYSNTMRTIFVGIMSYAQLFWLHGRLSMGSISWNCSNQCQRGARQW